ncbi:putative RNA ligase/AAA domain containing protein [Trypanosoma cruzi]|uniref:Putative RNA ligase/AAA domain containing protein n=1 Tax=Trypanosoma cruzi TaxID=5693 RepID=A0A2V2WI98_TRYCR|nr:putative RNA ligase/AAA domain containing protein [Trypanosoma cruzi]
METFLDGCFFKKPWTDGRVEGVVEYAGTGKGRLFCTGAFTSFEAKESHQGDVKCLPTGARTLLLDADASKVMVRGVDKFFDLEDDKTEELNKDELWEMGSVWLQRKVAGFTVTLFSLDGESVGVATKHVVEGLHVDLARCVLDHLLSAEQQKLLAFDLFSVEAAVCCECVSLKDDLHHPVLEPVEYDNKLFIFSVHKRNDLREIAVPIEKVQVMSKRWGLPVVPSWRAGGREKLQQWLQKREKWLGEGPDGIPLAEGYVVLVEIPVTRMSSSVVLEEPFTVAPLRLKAKTVKYRVLRSLRSILTGDSTESPKLFHDVLAVWSELIGGYKCFKQAVAQRGVCEICSQFETHVSTHSKRRLRGSHMSIGQAFEKLINFTEGEALVKRRASLNVIMLCGIPGAGKTTLSLALMAMAERGDSPFRYLIYLSRDQVARDVAAREGIDDSSSKHKQRKLRAMAHHALLEAVKQAVLFSLIQEGPGLLLMDACNARAETRRVWRGKFPPKVEGFRLLYVTCSDHPELLRRLAKRRDHDVIRNNSEAQTVLYAVKKVFLEPLEDELCLQLDTASTSAEDIARYVFSLYKGDRQRYATVYDYRGPEEGLKALRATLVESLLGPVGEGASTLLTSSVKRIKTSNAIFVRLEISSDELLQIASEAIMAVTGMDCLSLSWWEKFKRALGIEIRPLCSTIEDGHTRWIHGWLFDGRKEGKAFSADAWRHALTERFECRASAPHVTFAHDASSVESSPLVPEAGSMAEVNLTSILLDRFAICFGAIAVVNGQRYEKQLGLSEAVPLHVTVCHTERVKPSYAGEMFDLFRQWGRHNKELQHMKSGVLVKRSRLKFFNFLKLRLERSVALRGIVVSET